MESGMRTASRGSEPELFPCTALCCERARVGGADDDDNSPVAEVGVKAGVGKDLLSPETMCLEMESTSAANSSWNPEMEAGITEELMETVADSASPKTSCSDQTMSSEASGLGTVEMKAGIRVAKAEDREYLVVCKRPFSSKAEVPEDRDLWLLKQMNETTLGPVTPLPDRGAVEFSSLSDRTEEAGLVYECQTPSEVIFDPFAPGPEELMFAPKKKMLKQTWVPIRRQLKFDYCCDSIGKSEDNVLDVAEEEERFLEMVYRSFLDVIVSNQVGEFSGESPLEESTLSNGLKTPTSLPFLTGIAETCPSAPVRPTLKSRKLTIGICRKLEF